MQYPIDFCARYHGGDRESLNAHASINVSALKEKVLGAVKQLGDATSDEVEAYLGMTHQTAAARMAELKHDGELVPTGERRKTRSGRFAKVWKVRDGG